MSIPTRDIPEDLQEQLAQVYFRDADRWNTTLRRYHNGLDIDEIAMIQTHVEHTTKLGKHFAQHPNIPEEAREELMAYQNRVVESTHKPLDPDKPKKGFFTEADGSFSMGRLISFQLIQVGAVIGLIGAVAALYGNENALTLLAFAGSFLGTGTGAKVWQKKYEQNGHRIR